MALERHLICERATGLWGAGKDRWMLIVHTDTGEKLVQHEWSLDNPDKGEVSHGAKTISLVDFLKSDQSDDEAKEKLGKLLKDMGLNDAARPAEV
jgi:hypothetical protein